MRGDAGMRYTKYSYKRRNQKNKSFLPIVLITLFSIVIGFGGAWVIYEYVIPKDSKIPTDVEIRDEAKIQESREDFIFVQCGYFAKKENADMCFQKVDDSYLSFIVEEDSKYRVSAGIYTRDEGIKKMESLNKDGIEASKMSFYIPKDNKVDTQILAIVNGSIDIFNTLGNEGVKSFNTKQFKDYVNGLEVIESGERIELLNNLKKHVSELNDEMTKDDVNEEMQFIYSVLLNYKK